MASIKILLIKCQSEYIMMITRSLAELVVWGLIRDRIVGNEAQEDKVINKTLRLLPCLVTYYLIYK